MNQKKGLRFLLIIALILLSVNVVFSQDKPLNSGGCLFNADCDDNDPCTDDLCSGGSCQNTLNPNCLGCFSDYDCDDNDPCTNDFCQDEACYNRLIYGCSPPSPDLCTGITCDDEDPCTSDSCDPATGCQYIPISGCGGGGDSCTGVNCDDEDPCTSDSCNNGVCENIPIPDCGSLCSTFDCNTVTCPGGDSGTGTSSELSAVTGGFWKNFFKDMLKFFGFNVDEEKGLKGELRSFRIPGDSDALISPEDCCCPPGGGGDGGGGGGGGGDGGGGDGDGGGGDGGGDDDGTCLGGCDDGEACTRDFCRDGLCMHTLDDCFRSCTTDADCSDGNLCNGDEPCVNGRCFASLTPRDCSDGDPCTSDTCNPSDGICSHTAIPNCGNNPRVPCTFEERGTCVCSYTINGRQYYNDGRGGFYPGDSSPFTGAAITGDAILPILEQSETNAEEKEIRTIKDEFKDFSEGVNFLQEFLSSKIRFPVGKSISGSSLGSSCPICPSGSSFNGLLCECDEDCNEIFYTTNGLQCAYSCGSDQRCDNGECVSACDVSQCEIYDKNTNSCVSRCRDCKTCDNGWCIPLQTNSCEYCDETTGTIQPRGNSCTTCNDGILSNNCGPCETCENDQCTPLPTTFCPSPDSCERSLYIYNGFLNPRTGVCEASTMTRSRETCPGSDSCTITDINGRSVPLSCSQSGMHCSPPLTRTKCSRAYPFLFSQRPEDNKILEIYYCRTGANGEFRAMLEIIENCGQCKTCVENNGAVSCAPREGNCLFDEMPGVCNNGVCEEAPPSSGGCRSNEDCGECNYCRVSGNKFKFEKDGVVYLLNTGYENPVFDRITIENPFDDKNHYVSLAVFELSSYDPFFHRFLYESGKKTILPGESIEIEVPLRQDKPFPGIYGVYIYEYFIDESLKKPCVYAIYNDEEICPRGDSIEIVEKLLAAFGNNIVPRLHDSGCMASYSNFPVLKDKDNNDIVCGEDESIFECVKNYIDKNKEECYGFNFKSEKKVYNVVKGPHESEDGICKVLPIKNSECIDENGDGGFCRNQMVGGIQRDVCVKSEGCAVNSDCSKNTQYTCIDGITYEGREICVGGKCQVAEEYAYESRTQCGVCETCISGCNEDADCDSGTKCENSVCVSCDRSCDSDGGCVYTSNEEEARCEMRACSENLVWKEERPMCVPVEPFTEIKSNDYYIARDIQPPGCEEGDCCAPLKNEVSCACVPKGYLEEDEEGSLSSLNAWESQETNPLTGRVITNFGDTEEKLVPYCVAEPRVKSGSDLYQIAVEVCNPLYSENRIPVYFGEFLKLIQDPIFAEAADADIKLNMNIANIKGNRGRLILEKPYGSSAYPATFRVELETFLDMSNRERVSRVRYGRDEGRGYAMGEWADFKSFQPPPYLVDPVANRFFNSFWPDLVSQYGHVDAERITNDINDNSVVINTDEILLNREYYDSLNEAISKITPYNELLMNAIANGLANDNEKKLFAFSSFRLADLLIRSGDIEGAICYYRKIISAFSTSQIGNILTCDDIEDLYVFSPGYNSRIGSEAHHGLGRAYLIKAINNPPTSNAMLYALKHLNYASKLNPGNKEARTLQNSLKYNILNAIIIGITGKQVETIESLYEHVRAPDEHNCYAGKGFTFREQEAKDTLEGLSAMKDGLYMIKTMMFGKLFHYEDIEADPNVARYTQEIIDPYKFFLSSEKEQIEALNKFFGYSPSLNYFEDERTAFNTLSILHSRLCNLHSIKCHPDVALLITEDFGKAQDLLSGCGNSGDAGELKPYFKILNDGEGYHFKSEADTWSNFFQKQINKQNAVLLVGGVGSAVASGIGKATSLGAYWMGVKTAVKEVTFQKAGMGALAIGGDIVAGTGVYIGVGEIGAAIADEAIGDPLAGDILNSFGFALSQFVGTRTIRDAISFNSQGEIVKPIQVSDAAEFNEVVAFYMANGAVDIPGTESFKKLRVPGRSFIGDFEVHIHNGDLPNDYPVVRINEIKDVMKARKARAIANARCLPFKSFNELAARLRIGDFTPDEMRRIDLAQKLLGYFLEGDLFHRKVALIMAHYDPVTISKVWRLGEAGFTKEEILLLGDFWVFGNEPESHVIRPFLETIDDYKRGVGGVSKGDFINARNELIMSYFESIEEIARDLSNPRKGADEISSEGFEFLNNAIDNFLNDVAIDESGTLLTIDDFLTGKIMKNREGTGIVDRMREFSGASNQQFWNSIHGMGAKTKDGEILSYETEGCINLDSEKTQTDIFIEESKRELLDQFKEFIIDPPQNLNPELTELERDVVMGLWGIGGTPKKTLKELSEKHEITTQRIKQARDSAMDKLIKFKGVIEEHVGKISVHNFGEKHEDIFLNPGDIEPVRYTGVGKEPLSYYITNYDGKGTLFVRIARKKEGGVSEPVDHYYSQHTIGLRWIDEVTGEPIPIRTKYKLLTSAFYNAKRQGRTLKGILYGTSSIELNVDNRWIDGKEIIGDAEIGWLPSGGEEGKGLLTIRKDGEIYTLEIDRRITVKFINLKNEVIEVRTRIPKMISNKYTPNPNKKGAIRRSFDYRILYDGDTYEWKCSGDKVCCDGSAKLIINRKDGSGEEIIVRLDFILYYENVNGDIIGARHLMSERASKKLNSEIIFPELGDRYSYDSNFKGTEKLMVEIIRYDGSHQLFDGIDSFTVWEADLEGKVIKSKQLTSRCLNRERRLKNK